MDREEREKALTGWREQRSATADARKARDIKFFRPLWRRVAVLTVCVVWAVLEAWKGEQTWIFITLGLTAYAVWTLFIKFPKDGEVVAAPPATPAVESKGGPDVPPQA